MCGDPDGFYGDCACEGLCQLYSNINFGFCPEHSGPCYNAWGDCKYTADFNPANAVECRPGLECVPLTLGTPCGSDADCAGEDRPSKCAPATDGESYCFFTTCLRPCDENGDCPEGEQPTGWDIGCYCEPELVGTARFGEDCNYHDILNPADADYCLSEFECVALPNQDSPCETDEDCLDEADPSTCSNHEDGYRYCFRTQCARPCDENGACQLDERNIGLEAACFCEPKLVGTAAFGEDCNYRDIFNPADADYCISDLECIQLPNLEFVCANDDACSGEEYPSTCWDHDDGDRYCFRTQCLRPCDESGACGAGEEVMLFGESCYCGPGSNDL